MLRRTNASAMEEDGDETSPKDGKIANRGTVEVLTSSNPIDVRQERKTKRRARTAAAGTGVSNDSFRTSQLYMKREFGPASEVSAEFVESGNNRLLRLMESVVTFSVDQEQLVTQQSGFTRHAANKELLAALERLQFPQKLISRQFQDVTTEEAYLHFITDRRRVTTVSAFIIVIAYCAFLYQLRLYTFSHNVALYFPIGIFFLICIGVINYLFAVRYNHQSFKSACRSARVSELCSLGFVVVVTSYLFCAYRVAEICAVNLTEQGANGDNAEQFCAGGLLLYSVSMQLAGYMLTAPIRSFFVAPITSFAVPILLAAGRSLAPDFDTTVQLYFRLGLLIVVGVLISVVYAKKEAASRRHFHTWVSFQRHSARRLVDHHSVGSSLETLLPSSILEKIVNKEPTIDVSTECTIAVIRVFDFYRFSTNTLPEILVDLLQLFFTAVEKQLNRYDVAKLKTVGDALICGSGLQDSEDHRPASVMQCALSAIRAYARSFLKTNSINFEVPVLESGVATGTAYGGLLGIRSLRYQVLGPAFEEAKRMAKCCGGIGAKMVASVSTMDAVNAKGDTSMFLFTHVKGERAVTVAFGGTSLKGKHNQTPPIAPKENADSAFRSPAEGFPQMGASFDDGFGMPLPPADASSLQVSSHRQQVQDVEARFRYLEQLVRDGRNESAVQTKAAWSPTSKTDSDLDEYHPDNDSVIVQQMTPDLAPTDIIPMPPGILANPSTVHSLNEALIEYENQRVLDFRSCWTLQFRHADVEEEYQQYTALHHRSDNRTYGSITLAAYTTGLLVLAVVENRNQIGSGDWLSCLVIATVLLWLQEMIVFFVPHKPFPKYEAAFWVVIVLLESLGLALLPSDSIFYGQPSHYYCVFAVSFTVRANRLPWKAVVLVNTPPVVWAIFLTAFTYGKFLLNMLVAPLAFYAATYLSAFHQERERRLVWSQRSKAHAAVIAADNEMRTRECLIEMMIPKPLVPDVHERLRKIKQSSDDDAIISSLWDVHILTIRMENLSDLLRSASIPEAIKLLEEHAATLDHCFGSAHAIEKVREIGDLVMYAGPLTRAAKPVISGQSSNVRPMHVLLRDHFQKHEVLTVNVLKAFFQGLYLLAQYNNSKISQCMESSCCNNAPLRCEASACSTTTTTSTTTMSEGSSVIAASEADSSSCCTRAACQVNQTPCCSFSAIMDTGSGFATVMGSSHHHFDIYGGVVRAAEDLLEAAPSGYVGLTDAFHRVIQGAEKDHAINLSSRFSIGEGHRWRLRASGVQYMHQCSFLSSEMKEEEHLQQQEGERDEEDSPCCGGCSYDCSMQPNTCT